MTPQRLLDRAKVGLMTKKNSVFISTILFSLKHVWDDTLNPPTAATDGLTLYIHPDYFTNLTDEERVGLLVHECWHVAWNHMARGKHLQRQRYNWAADYVINLMLTDAGFALPAGALNDAKYRGMSTREVYDKLPEQKTIKISMPGGQGGGKPGDKNKPGDIIYDKGDKESKEKEMQISNTIVKAIMRSEMEGDAPGTVPGELARHIDELINPKLAWNVLLQNYMSNFQKDDYSYHRGNRRYMPDFYLPAQYSERVANVSAAIDLSGSISDEQLQAFLSELSYIQSVLRPETMNILGFDTRISDNHVIMEGDDILDLKFTGGGGTKITPVLKYFNKIKPTVAIIFTDMYFENYKIDPEFEHIWVIIDNPTCVPKDGEFAHYNF